MAYSSEKRTVLSLNKTDEKVEKLRKLVRSYTDIYSQAIEEGSRQRSFSYGQQWDSASSQLAENNNIKPLVQNEISKHLKAVIAEFSNNMPTPTSMATTPNQDPQDVELFNAIVDSSIKRSDFKEAIVQAYEDALRTGCGGAIYVYTDYQSDDSFKQEIYTKYIDYTSVFFDPYAKSSTKNDGDFCGYFQRMPVEEFEVMFPDVDVDNTQSIEKEWGYYNEISDTDNSKSITVAHIFVREYQSQTLYRTTNDRTIENEDELEDGEQVLMERESKKSVIKAYMMDGVNILSECDYPFDQMPVIYLSGYQTIIDSQIQPYSFGYDMEDMQRVKNWGLSQVGNMLLNLRKENFIVDIKDMTQEDLAIYTNPMLQQGILPFNSSHTSIPPTRIPAPELSQSLIGLISQTGQQIDSTMGRYEDVQGASNGNISGVARELSISQNNISIFFYVRNAVYTVTQMCRLITEIIPKIYVEERLIKTEMGTIGINSAQSDNYKNLDMSKIDTKNLAVDVKVGASFEIQKQKYMERISQLIEKMPSQMQIILLPELLKLYDIPNTAAVNSKILSYMKLNSPQIAAIMEGIPDDQLEEHAKQAQAQQQQMIAAQQSEKQQAMQLEQQNQAYKQQELQLKEQSQKFDQLQAISQYQLDTEKLDQSAQQMNYDQRSEEMKTNAENKKSLVELLGKFN